MKPVGSWRSRFPSPCGEKVGINAGCEAGWVLAVKVSVPLRGKGRDQLQQAGWVGGEYLDVSVPLRGKGRDQHYWNFTQQRWVRLTFPSPCGEKVGINSNKIL